MATWYAVVDRATGALVSVDTVLADDAGDRYEVVEIGGEVPGGAVWDAAARGFVPAPPPPPPPPDPAAAELDAAIAQVEALAIEAGGSMADVVRRQKALSAATANALKLLRGRRDPMGPSGGNG